MKKVVDQTVREQAISIERSFIVQAPAGSGKTALLTQRYLALLSICAQPENILAITFTRKAAAEMKLRILQALKLAKSLTAEPQEDYLKATWHLAKKALEQDSLMGWNLLVNPSRLKVKTIDGFCSGLVRQLPILSDFSGHMSISENANAFYYQAAENTVLLLHEEEYASLLEPLYQHLDGDMGKMVRLIVNMLSTRLNWQPIINNPKYHDCVEFSWEIWLQKRVMLLAKAIEPWRNVLSPLWQFSCNQLVSNPSNTKDFKTVDWDSFSKKGWPDTDLRDLPIWKIMAKWLLTADGGWRKRVDKNLGFPSEGKDANDIKLFKEKKQQMMAFHSSCIENSDAENLRKILIDFTSYPIPQFDDEQRQLLVSLIDTLKLAQAQLVLGFAEKGELDFSEIANRADRALGEAEQPTDLSLRLDYQIQHILVDEFQDTSQGQKNLLQKLTFGWMPEDGRTLFLVGDPMQSIYRFRAADVSIFIDCWQNKLLGDVPVTPLQLSCNFRSQENIVNWVNDAFVKIFPTCNDLQYSAVEYSASTAMRPALEHQAVEVFLQAASDDKKEALWIIEHIKNIQTDDSEETIALLVRSRTHLSTIAQLLREQNILFEAIDIEPLSQRPVIQDLLSLTHALLDSSDRIHWLALLRGPFCGLDLQDLTRLIEHQSLCIPQLLCEQQSVAILSDEGKQRVHKIQTLIKKWLLISSTKPLVYWIESAWLYLGGPATTDEQGLIDVATFFDALNRHNQQPNSDFSLAEFSASLEKLYAAPEIHQGKPIYLMTMHKSKGLEFDHVFLPGLGRATRCYQGALLEWLDGRSEGGEEEILLSPIKGKGADAENEFYQVIVNVKKQQEVFETQRLLYVACTRAIKKIYFSGALTEGKDAPISSSLLSQLWPILSVHLDDTTTELEENTKASELIMSPTPENYFTRLSQDYFAVDTLPNLIEPVLNSNQNDLANMKDEVSLEFSWSNDMSRIIGIVAHQFFQYLAEFNSVHQITSLLTDENSVDEYIEQSSAWLMQQFEKKGGASQQCQTAMIKLRRILKSFLLNEKGRWILSTEHQDARNEWALSFRPHESKEHQQEENLIKHVVIDRSFVDNRQRRWIIDYKTGDNQGGDLQTFLDSEFSRYRPQLENYALALSKIDHRPIMLGLYYPVIEQWIEWQWQPLSPYPA